MNDERYVLAELKREMARRCEQNSVDKLLYASDVLVLIAKLEASAVLGYEEEPTQAAADDGDLPWQLPEEV